MRIVRSLLLILLMVAVPVSGFASALMQHCQHAARTSSTVHQHHAGISMPDMTGAEHQLHMQKAGVKVAGADTTTLDSCQCGCPCKGHCPPGSCIGSLAALSQTRLSADFSSARQAAPAAPSHALAAHSLDRLRPPIG
jgi:hypothetical protein